MPKKKLGEILLERRLIDADQLASALAYQRQWGHRLGTALVVKGFISEGTLMQVLSQTLNIPLVDLSRVQPQKEAIKLLAPSFCESHEVVPIFVEGSKGRRTLTLAMSDPLNLNVLEEVGFTTGCRVKPVIASMTAIGEAIRAWVLGERVDISPLSFERKHGGNEGGDEKMTLVRSGGEEMVLGSGLGPLTAPPPTNPGFSAPPATGPGLAMPPGTNPGMAMPPGTNPGLPVAAPAGAPVPAYSLPTLTPLPPGAPVPQVSNPWSATPLSQVTTAPPPSFGTPRPPAPPPQPTPAPAFGRPGTGSQPLPTAPQPAAPAFGRPGTGSQPLPTAPQQPAPAFGVPRTGSQALPTSPPAYAPPGAPAPNPPAVAVVGPPAPPVAQPYAGPPAPVPTNSLPMLQPLPPGHSGPNPALPVASAVHDPTEELEKKFWALMRILARKGIITKEEFLKELRGSGG
ncbi:MAG: hypothetical protein AB2A00_22115 [Myxococcota bacterium]